MHPLAANSDSRITICTKQWNERAGSLRVDYEDFALWCFSPMFLGNNKNFNENFDFVECFEPMFFDVIYSKD